jgi:sugar lactone lactonase YvrE
VDLATGTSGTVIAVPDGVGDLAISPDGVMAYATGNTYVVIGGRNYNPVTPIDLKTGVAETPIELRYPPDGIALSPDGRTAYFTGGPNVPGDGSPVHADVISVDLDTGRVDGTFRIPGGAGAIFNSTSSV